MRNLCAFLLLPLLSSCYFQRPVQTQRPVNNADYKVDYLFEHEGCKVYRFYDMGRYVYFTNCRGEALALTDSTAIRTTSFRLPR